MLHRSVSTDRAQKVFLATPAYSGVEAGYAFALFESVKALEQAGIASELAIFANDCHVDDSRNRLVRQFLMSDCDDLVFLDSDLRWEAKDLVKLCQFDVDVVGGTYPLKQEKTDYPVRLLSQDGELWEAEGLPTGFLRVKRRVFEALSSQSAQYFGKRDNHTPTPLIFERSLEGTARWGGDYTFCRKWKELGGRLWLYPNPIFEHIGSHTWSGSYVHYTEERTIGAINAGLNAIRENRATPVSMKALYDGWGNEWAGDSDLLTAVSLLAEGKTILECGSGLTTLVLLAAGGTVVSLEHSEEYGKVTLAAMKEFLTEEELNRGTLMISPLVDGWYSTTPELQIDLLVCDGPPRQLGDRSKVERLLPLLDGPIVMDDFNPAIDLPVEWHKLSERVSIGHRTDIN